MSVDTINRWETLAESGHLTDAAVAYVAARDWVTFADLQQRLAPFMPTTGTISIEPRRNAVVWAGVSDEFADLIISLQSARRVFAHPCSQLRYLADGMMLNLPLARIAPGPAGFSTPLWVVTALRVVPYQ